MEYLWGQAFIAWHLVWDIVSKQFMAFNALPVAL
jgi:hypothetical protein